MKTRPNNAATRTSRRSVRRHPRGALAAAAASTVASLGVARVASSPWMMNVAVRTHDGAHFAKNQVHLGSLRGEDLFKAVCLVLVLIGTIMVCGGSDALLKIMAL